MNNVVLVGGFVEIVELCEELNINILGIIDPKLKNCFLGYPILGTDADLQNYYPEIKNASLIITPDLPVVRKKLFSYYQKFKFSFFNLMSTNAKISKSASIDFGSVIQHNVNVSSEVKIGKFVKLNTNANVMHNSTVGDFTTIAPNAVILGNVNIGNMCYIGANATILSNLTICDNTVIGAGAVVTKNIEIENGTYAGIPAKLLK